MTIDVPLGGFFKLHLSMMAPEHSRHYKAIFQLADLTGNSFGEQVDLDIIVEDEHNKSVILKEVMEIDDISFDQNQSKG